MSFTSLHFTSCLAYESYGNQSKANIYKLNQMDWDKQEADKLTHVPLVLLCNVKGSWITSYSKQSQSNTADKEGSIVVAVAQKILKRRHACV